MIKHPIPPFYNENSKILILGSFPSVKSREQMFYYGHPQNRFWQVISAVYNKDTPCSVEEKKTLLTDCGIALSDVVYSCDIKGSADSSIKNVIPSDLTKIINSSKIEKIFVNGKTAEKLYIKYIFPKTGIEAILLPSTSPANAVWSLEKLIQEWEIIKK